MLLEDRVKKANAAGMRVQLTTSVISPMGAYFVVGRIFGDLAAFDKWRGATGIDPANAAAATALLQSLTSELNEVLVPFPAAR